MMAEIDLMDRYPKPKRNLDERASNKTPEDVMIARKFGKEYFDGPRSQGYGGYRYDGRWIPVVQRFIEHYNLSNKSKILDVGCAKGFMLYDFMQALPGITIRGIDISPYAIEHALLEVKPFLSVGNAKFLNAPDKSFDLIISINTVHNLPPEECEQAIREIQRVGKHAFIINDAWKTEEEHTRMQKWNLTAQTYMHVDGWKKLFEEVGYTGDYYWFIP